MSNRNMQEKSKQIPKKESSSLNQKIKELDEKVEWFNSDAFELEMAMSKYKEALKLAKEIEEDLKELKNEVEVLEVDFAKES